MTNILNFLAKTALSAPIGKEPLQTPLFLIKTHPYVYMHPLEAWADLS
jgi:hypothetical protein